MKTFTYAQLETINQIRAGKSPAKVSRSLIAGGFVALVNGDFVVTPEGDAMRKATEAKAQQKADDARRTAEAQELRRRNKADKAMWG